MKCTTRQMAISRYGKIDMARRHWPHQEVWMKSLLIPDDWFINWKVLDTKHSVHSIYCNIDIHAPLFNALKDIKAAGAGHHLHTFNGCFNIRAVRGSTNVSSHAYGLGVDINAQEIPLGNSRRLPDVIVNAFRKYGFDYGGDWHGRKDGQHLSRCWE